MLRILGITFVTAVVACGGSTSEGDSDSPGDAPASPSAPPWDPPAPGPAPNGGNCTYENVLGTATITSIEEPGELAYACTNDGVVARFSFVPDDPSAPSVPAKWQQVDEGNRTLEQGAKLATRGCLAELGLEVGSTFRVERVMETSGTCTPVMYIPQIDVDACKTPCDR